MMEGVQHAPHREATDETLRVIADFAGRVLDDQQR